ncbi:hypothetical protein Ddye_008943 [Dipteronia dyeriana]|uniref:Uncharacterized protein n=1 Tax=Dipteronia dyeriana TaxID=168575 RepID=A0AAD9XAF2_9ROSI|nr:hypothetical protein Ddye_008943 [Dipteronia dyeriana]
MASDNKVATIVEENGRGSEQRTHTTRNKSKGSSTDALETQIVGLEEAISGIESTLSDVANHIDCIEANYADVRTEWASYKTSPTVGHTTTSSTTTLIAIQVPKPTTYNGTRNAIEVENFIFGLEQYFEAKGARDDATKIANAPTFLRDAAQL